MLDLALRHGSWTCLVPLDSHPVTLGRAEACDVVIPDNAISRQHCRVFPDADGWRIEDLASRIGTHLNGVRITEPASLARGDVVQLGAVTAVVLERAPQAVLTGDPVRDGRNLGALLRTLDRVYAADELDDVLRAVVDEAVDLARADRGALLLASGGRLEAAVARGADRADLALEEELGRTLPLRAMASGRATVIVDAGAVSLELEVARSVLRGALGCVVCVPLPGRAETLGVLYVDSRQPAELFGPTELAVFELMARHAAAAIERAAARRERSRAMLAENARLRGRLVDEAPIGRSEAMARVLDTLGRVSGSDASICLIGETGAGKEVLARHIHRASARRAGPFVAVDCGAIPEALIESELFGHERGAFTGAAAARPGRFREAHGGTLFLDEIGELPLPLQTRLLRVLQERTVSPVGGTGRLPVDVRVVCATHRDLERMVAAATFREDLYYRLAVVTVPIPPLRARGDDVHLLARHFLDLATAEHGVPFSGFSREATEAMASHRWPGNVRELGNRVQRAVLLGTPPVVTRRDLGLLPEGREETAPRTEADDSPLAPLKNARRDAARAFERTYVEEALRRTGGVVAAAARIAGVSRQHLTVLMQTHDIARARFSRRE